MRDGEAPTSSGSLKGGCNGLWFGSFDKAGRGKLCYEVEHRLCEDVTNGLKFRECVLEKPFNLVLNGSDERAERFPFPGYVSEVLEVLRDGYLAEGRFVREEELGDRDSVLLVGLGLSEGKFGEIGNEEGVDNDSIDAFEIEERKEVDVVTAGGLHGNYGGREFAAVSEDGFKEFGEAGLIHVCGDRETNIAFGTESRSRKGILGDVNTDEQIVQRGTSLKCLDKAGEASRPILHDDKGSETQSTYNGFGRQGTDSFEGSMTQV